MAALVLAAAAAPALIVRLRQRRGWVRQRAHRRPGYGVSLFRSSRHPCRTWGGLRAGASGARRGTARSRTAPELQSRATSAWGADRSRGVWVGRSILQLQTGSRQRARGSTIRAISAAGRGSGTAGAVGVAIAAVTCVFVTLWWLPVTTRVLGTAPALLVLVAAALVDAGRAPAAEPARRGRPRARARHAAVAASPAVLRGVVAGAALVGGPLLLTHLVSPAGMGFGDVKAGAVLGAALGLLDPAARAVRPRARARRSAAICGLARGARSVPLGPALVAGALAALAAGHVLDPEGRLWT